MQKEVKLTLKKAQLTAVFNYCKGAKADAIEATKRDTLKDNDYIINACVAVLDCYLIANGDNYIMTIDDATAYILINVVMQYAIYKGELIKDYDACKMLATAQAIYFKIKNQYEAQQRRAIVENKQ